MSEHDKPKTRSDISDAVRAAAMGRGDFTVAQLPLELETEKVCQLADLNENFRRLLAILEPLAGKVANPLSFLTGSKKA